jgi:DNA (cytosine-5)-methyltransferase 1
VGYHDSMLELQPQGGISDVWRRVGDTNWWATEPDVGRVAHGISSRSHRLRSLGNAVVPQCAEVIGHMILEMATVGQ